MDRATTFKAVITCPHILFSFLAICVRIHLCPYTYMRDVTKNVAKVKPQPSMLRLYAEQVNSEDAIKAYKAVVR